jgi:hypothetical protein
MAKEWKSGRLPGDQAEPVKPVGEKTGASSSTRPRRHIVPILLAVAVGACLGLAGFVVVMIGFRFFTPDESQSVADLLRAQGGDYEFDEKGRVTQITTTRIVRVSDGEPQIYRKRVFYSPTGNAVRRIVETPSRETVEDVEPANGVYGEPRVIRDQVFLVGVPFPPRVLIYGGVALVILGASLVAIGLFFLVRPMNWFRRA